MRVVVWKLQLLSLSLALLVVVATTLVLVLRKVRPGQSTGPMEGSERLRRQVREVCTAFNVSSRVTSLQLRHIYVDDTRRILYCSAQKVASTAWKKVWLRLTSPPQRKSVAVTNRYDIHLRSQQNMLIQPKFEDVWQDMLATYRKFLFVRHPFQRVVSAYRDKVQFVRDMEDSEIPQLIKKKMSQSSRASPTKAAEEVVGFAEFVKFIVEQDDEDIIPWDSHWRSVHQLCNPCGIEYDFIGKFENLPDDADYVLRWLGVQDLVGSFPTTPKSNKAEADVASQYLKELDNSIKMSFLHKYRLDFLSFHYEFD